MAQGYAFGRPAPLPSPTEVLIRELNAALADDGPDDGPDDVAAEPAEPLTLPVQRTAAAPEFAEETENLTGEFARTGELFEELADEHDD